MKIYKSMLAVVLIFLMLPAFAEKRLNSANIKKTSTIKPVVFDKKVPVKQITAAPVQTVNPVPPDIFTLIVLVNLRNCRIITGRRGHCLIRFLMC